MPDDVHRLGFVGFGAMPRRMAVRLQDASFSVVAFDPSHQGGNIGGVMALGTAALAKGLGYGARAGVGGALLIDALSNLILVSEHHKRKLAMVDAMPAPAGQP